MKTFKALVKREFWEHKGSFFYAPAVMVIVFAVMLVVFGLSGDRLIIDGEHEISFSEQLPKVVSSFEQLPEEAKEKAVTIGLSAPAMLFGFVMLFISMFYCLNSLYEERKDRSILFWKSLPVSDIETILSKFVSVVFLVPAIYFAVIVVFQLFILIYVTVGSWFGGGSGVTIWTASNLFALWFNMLVAMIGGSLWLAPLWGWFMLASSWAKKVSFLWGGLPIMLVIVCEGYIFRTTEFAQLIGERIAEGFAIQNYALYQLAGGDILDFEVNSALHSFVSAEFWGGLIVAAVLLSGAVYIRRFRDES
ncbi:ABC-2 transporter permease [Aliikangiella coralliicola]|uniref:Uncharacterized protein n=1 Tax=Aliikangiella coralliicola TaxID=2592383 RepID=A0A545UDE1_9GAMM|nr:ABC-2 transporter permease [Aliikangiella coralliicola]TQV87481.1 hypothetical protein FLL46_11430 [Aliikangiella coralliicola]